MKLNLDYYKQDITYNKYEDETNIINKYINNYDESDFEEVISNNNVNLSEFSILTEIRKNIISWYPFKKDCTILEIGAGLGEITGELCEKASRVVSIEFSKERAEAIAKRHKNKENLEVIVGDLKDIEFKEKFDYVILIGVIEYSNMIYQTENSLNDFLKFSKCLIKKDGKLLIATDNKFGMKNWSNIIIDENNINYDAVSIDKTKSKNQTYSKMKLEEIFNKLNIGERKYYYPLPNYKFTNVIFTDKNLPNEEKILRNITIFDNNEIINFNENSAYKQLLKRNIGMFSFFANSFFIEISDNFEDNNIEFVSFSNMKKSKYRLKTIIKNDEVYKLATNSKSVEHLQSIKENIDILKKHQINTLDSYDDEKIISKYVKNEKSYDQVIMEEFNIKGLEAALNLIEKFKKDVISKFDLTDCDDNVFDKYKITYDKNKIKKLNFLNIGLWDLTFQNSFYIDGKFYFYDQEWRNSKIPLEFIIYRNIEYLDTLKRRTDVQLIYNKLGITEYLEIFKELDDKLQEEIRDNTVYSMYIKPMRTVKGLIIENDKIKSELTNERRITNEQKDNINILTEKINEKQEELNLILNSKSWRFLTKIRKCIYRFKNLFKK